METPTRILLVEDDGVISHILKLAMHDLGWSYHVDVAFSADEGLDMWRQEPYHLLITDYNLRGRSGLDLVTQLKRDGATAPMMLVTAYDTPQLRKDAKQAGVDQFVAKPFFIDKFLDLARSLLPNSASELGA